MQGTNFFIRLAYTPLLVFETEYMEEAEEQEHFEYLQ